MLKINLQTTTISDSIINSIGIGIIIFISLFYNRYNIAYASDNSWIKVSKSPSGIQYIDKDSLYNKERGIIDITTKYIKIDPNNPRNIEENLYLMRINCLTNKYKDISVNGRKYLTTKWEAPDGDKLINDVISFSCENV